MSFVAMHNAYFDTLLEELEAQGVPRDALPGRRGDNVSPFVLARALGRAIELTGDPAFAIAYGRRLNLASHGILGYALMSSRNGDQLLGLLTRYAALVVPDLTLRRVIKEDEMHLVCDVRPGPLPREFLIELVLTTLVNGARVLFNRPTPGAQAWFDYASPAHAQDYGKLRVPVRFGQVYSALVCKRSFLEMRVSSANPLMAEVGARQCDDLLKAMHMRSGISMQVRRVLLQARGAFPSQTEMAARLNVSTRTLRRRLDGEGTSYRDVFDEVRFEVAKQYLRTPELTVGQIAGLLDYDDPANFRRAFKRWSGTSAKQWRDSAALKED